MGNFANVFITVFLFGFSALVCITQTLKTTIGTVVSHEQIGYIKRRFIGTNIRAIRHILNYIETIDSSGTLKKTF